LNTPGEPAFTADCSSPGAWLVYEKYFRTRRPAPDTSRDSWKPGPATQFDDGPVNGDAGTRRALEMVAAAILD
jgi:hypothetical protein